MGRNPKWWKDPALVTILVAVVTGAWVVSSRIGSVEAALTEHEIAADDRFGKLETAMSDRFGKLETSMSDRFGRLESTMSERFGAVEARLAALEARMDLLLQGLDITVAPKSISR
ncbi:MAG: hypothetical protein OXL34_10335 [Gemmatimonadota bacterium]|nr:hypothetical protein [Gemmatimonadota bacterium]